MSVSLLINQEVRRVYINNPRLKYPLPSVGSGEPGLNFEEWQEYFNSLTNTQIMFLNMPCINMLLAALLAEETEYKLLFQEKNEADKND